jgi:hypothetical protein
MKPQQYVGIENRDDAAARNGRQSDVVVNAVFDSVPSHLPDSFVAPAVSLAAECDQVAKINARAPANLMERNLSLVEETGQFGYFVFGGFRNRGRFVN